MADSGEKRSRETFESTNGNGKDVEDSSSDDDFGPTLPSDAPKKKKRKLPYEKLYIDALPSSPRYSKSLMHKDQLTFVTVTPSTDFLITSSVDGVVKFWKKAARGVEAVKEFRAHNGEVRSVSVSTDGRSFASAGADKTVKIFDVVNFDLLAILQLSDEPRAICWVHRRGASLPLLAVATAGSADIAIYDGRGESQTPLHTISKLHRSPVRVIAYNNQHDCAVSADEGGMLEYWRPHGTYEKPDNVFRLKSATDLFAFKKGKSAPVSITMSPSGARFATFSFPDRKVRVFEFASGKLYRTYDESIGTITDMQQAGTALRKYDDVEFGKRLAVERELDIPTAQPRVNVIFDESSHFIIYGSLQGVKILNTLTNRVVKVYGEHEQLRALNVALYQGAPQKKSLTTVAMAASANPLLQEAEERDPMLVCTAVAKQRFFMFTDDTEISKSSRDVQNERAVGMSSNSTSDSAANKTQSGTQATLHTTMGDITLRLFPASAPKAVENFVTHARRGYYNETIFHRVIKRFMIQGGDPLGDGTGGESIWGKEFEDEFVPSLKHDQPFTLSMANAGPNTNGSQFFITTERCPWLDGKHTVFGRATSGMDVVKRIEGVKTYKEKPEEEIKILNIDVA